MFKPFNDNVVIQIQDTQKNSVITIPDAVQERPTAGIIIAVGPGRYEFGKLVPMTAKEGDLVVWSRGAENKVTYGNKDYIIVCELDLLTSVKEK